jgi:energy-coupling factor transport system substrate-specific component
MPVNMEKWKFTIFIVIVTVLLALSISTAKQNWGLLSMEIVIIAIILLYCGFEKSLVSSKEIAIIAVLATVAAVGRVSFAALPSVQPTTFLVIISGYVFGPRCGFMVGSTAALISNCFLGQGPWTPWQMFVWGMAGSSAGLFRNLSPGAGRRWMLAFQVFWGYAFGAIINLWSWAAFIKPLSWHSFLATYAASFWPDTFHAVGNAVFYLVFGAGAVKALQRVKHKLEVSYLPVQNPAERPLKNIEPQS